MVNLKIKKKTTNYDSKCLTFLVYKVFYVLWKANTITEFQLSDSFLTFYG